MQNLGQFQQIILIEGIQNVIQDLKFFY